MLFPQHKGSKSFRTCKLFRKKNDVFLKIILGLSTGVNVLGIPYSTISQGVSKYVFDMKFCRWTIFRYVQTKNVSRKEHVFRYLLMFLEQVFYFIHFVPIECVSRVFQTPQRYTTTKSLTPFEVRPVTLPFRFWESGFRTFRFRLEHTAYLLS